MYQTHIQQFAFVLVCLMVFMGCKGKIEKTPFVEINKEEIPRETSPESSINTNGSTISSRFSPPRGFERSEINSENFASYLRNIPLLDAGSKVHLFNGGLKSNQSIHAAILDIDVGDRDLQQCADAVMRLRAEYLWAQKKYNDIAFDFTNGWRFEYSKWRDGNNLVVNGNSTQWKPGSYRKESYQDFRTYIDWVFMYAGTLSLSNELNPKKLEDMEIGDVFIFGASPGHAVIVVDMAINPSTRDKAFLLAQSYMPAQQIHVLNNFNNTVTSPWYLLSEIDSQLSTPEWTFEKNALMQF